MGVSRKGEKRQKKKKEVAVDDHLRGLALAAIDDAAKGEYELDDRDRADLCEVLLDRCGPGILQLLGDNAEIELDLMADAAEDDDDDDDDDD